MNAHAELLRRATSDNELADAILKNYKTAPISPREMVMLDYAAQLTEDATKITPETHETLRSVGFDDTAILQITLGKTQFDNSFVFNNGIFQLLIRIFIFTASLLRLPTRRQFLCRVSRALSPLKNRLFRHLFPKSCGSSGFV